jgi:23S rRNA pseudouridine1911/1915/1917 synthase
MADSVRIIFEDSRLMVVYKPHGLQTEPDRFGHPDLLAQVRSMLSPSGKKQRLIQPVNRLDRPTAGLVLLAKTPDAVRRLNAMQEKREIYKEYEALLEGKMEETSGTWAHFLLKDTLHKKAHISLIRQPGYKSCLMEWRLLKVGRQSTLVRIRLKTGRYHQIRAQAAFMKHPVWGDIFYGSSHNLGMQAICLCAVRMAFIHPFTGADLNFELSASFDVI